MLRQVRIASSHVRTHRPPRPLCFDTHVEPTSAWNRQVHGTDKCMEPTHMAGQGGLPRGNRAKQGSAPAASAAAAVAVATADAAAAATRVTATASTAVNRQ